MPLMGVYDDDDDYEQEQQVDGPRQLREAHGKLTKENKALTRQLAELQEQVAEFQKVQRQQSIADLVGSKGLNPKVAKLVPADLAPDALDTWLNDYADVFGKAEKQDAEAVEQGTQPLAEEDDADYADLSSQWQKHQRATEGASSPGLSKLAESELTKLLDDPNISFDDLDAHVSKIPGFDVGKYNGEA